MAETEEQRAERIADALTDRDRVVCTCVIERGYPDPDCPHCDGQGGWLAGDDPAPGVALWPAMRNDRDFWRASEEEW